MIGELASRLSGSSDMFQPSGRGPTASINFVTTHDGFTLHDLVSYERKHNEANHEEQPRRLATTTAAGTAARKGRRRTPAIVSLRERQKRNLLATLFFSQGVPMLLAGDELGRTQQGNNNAYCQDNELSWLDWELDGEARALLDFTRRLIALRNAHPLFRRRTWFRGRAESDPDVVWLNYAGAEMTDQDWNAPARAASAC